MIIELKPDAFHLCLNLLGEWDSIEAKAVIGGINPGRVFVDCAETPRTAMIWLGNNDGFLFIGDAANEDFTNGLNHFIDTLIKPEAEKAKLTWFEAIALNESWYTVFKELFAHRKLESWQQWVYLLDETIFRKKEIPLEGGYQLVKIDRRLYESTNKFLRGKIAECWPSPEAFFENGFGYGVLYNNEVVSVCFSGFVYDGVHAIDLETIKAHRGKRLAEACAQAFVVACIKKGASSYWDCMDSNQASIAVAEKLGFKKARGYTGYDFPLV